MAQHAAGDAIPKKVAWFAQGTPVHKRRYCATRLMGRLTGPARLLAMSWPQQSFDAADGTLKLLRRLAKSPLVRKSLPNAAAICTQYFSFKRHPGESIGNFLVRETLAHEEFVEALIRLHEDKIGVSQDLKDFGLPTSLSEDQWWYDWYEYDDANSDVMDLKYLHVMASPRELRQAPHRATTEDQAMDSSPVMALLTPQPIDEISVADSFIMGVLRGWRLLQAAGLNAEEKRDILGSTKNSFLDYEVISSALQTLWDEQLLGHRSPLPHQGYSMVQSEHEAQYHDETWDNDAEWWNYETYYVHDDDDWWGEAWDYSEPTPATVAAASTEEAADDPQLREAQQAEKIAESLALDAQRTWTEARRATQALRKDRGFGAVASTTTGNGLRCFICGGPHLARDCPDRRHPSNWKGKGKHKGMMLDYDYYENYYTSKGLRGFPKGKSKGKGKKGSYMEAQAQWLKGKGKGQSHGHPFRSVNAYGAMELNLGGLEVSDAMDLTSSTTATSSRPELGMLDSGATASAAPEAVIQGLISSILEQDRSAKIEVDPTSRPYFRFGDGRWGRALYRTRLSSDVSGVERQFSLFALPNPPAFYQPGFDKSTLVPILVGMDFLGHKGSGMVIDFTTGLAMSTFDDTPDIYPLKSNPKGHFLLDICYHLTRDCIKLHNIFALQPLPAQCEDPVVHQQSRQLPLRHPCVMATPSPPQVQAATDLIYAANPKAKAKSWTTAALNLEIHATRGQPRTCGHASANMCLKQLKPLMEAYLPTAKIVRATQAKIDAEEILQHTIDEVKMSGPPPKSTSTATTSARPPVSPGKADPSEATEMADDEVELLTDGYRQQAQQE
ncbi:unnamed protein product [Symbiodinium pilosum]|uniref:Uncharacterized protein n=1 Tax=Symbiodinium pilosum TaxID=2952 RepID=A0A812KPH4_SYMPI|nr:unnamed protein product [Symbiodinium pilosum]